MKRVITYGTFDLLHQGHINILKKAKALGDYLVVGVTGDDYDYSRGKLNVFQSLAERIENVKKTGYADEIIVEEYLGQKVSDIQKYNIDTFVVGSDWKGKFDYLKEYCEVIYLNRTKNISSTELRNKKNNVLRLGIIGNGRIAARFLKESKYVSGIDVCSVYGRNEEKVKQFYEKFELCYYFTNYEKFLDTVDAVYIATPHTTHYEFAKKALLRNKHVLCEKPLTLSEDFARELFSIAEKNKLILMEAIKTVYAPCFNKLINIAKSGIVGKIVDVRATFTKLIDDKSLREYNLQLCGGSFTELATYPLCVIIKLLGSDIKEIYLKSIFDKYTNVDIFSKMNIEYTEAIATLTVGIGVKSEGDLVISGTKGYIYVPAPWWKTEFFEVKAEDPGKVQKFFTKFDGDGLRYELSEFVKSINRGYSSYKLSSNESILIAKIMEYFLKKFPQYNYVLQKA